MTEPKRMLIHAPQFNLKDDPLEGTNLIEASAGTGKTYTITGLFIRLILEKNLSADQILVVTFTDAATSELKNRIRTGLGKAINAFECGFSDDKFLNALFAKVQLLHSGEETIEILFERLNTVLQNFDEAAIYTIHGFCQRMLHDYAFESGVMFDTELITEQEALKREIVEDFWRKNLYNASRLFVNYVIENKKLTPDKLLEFIGNRISQPYLKIIPPVNINDSTQKEKAFQDAFDAVSKAWDTSKEDVKNILLNDDGLKRNSYKPEKIHGLIQGMDEYLALGNNHPSLFKDFELFTSGRIEISVKNKYKAPEHPFFNLCEDLNNRHSELVSIFEQRILAMNTELFQYVKEELKKRKQTQNTQSFDDLLLNLHNALEGKGGDILAESIRKKFKAALIDEFQDTDPVQYSIFKKIFDQKESILFLIGYPKQAIYSFRGADVFAYMDAAENAGFRYTLTENWRSEPDLIHAVNTIFENNNPAFIYDEIPFEPAKYPENKPDPVFLFDDSQTGEAKSKAPLYLWFVNAIEPTKPINKPIAKELIVNASCR